MSTQTLHSVSTQTLSRGLLGWMDERGRRRFPQTKWMHVQHVLPAFRACQSLGRRWGVGGGGGAASRRTRSDSQPQHDRGRERKSRFCWKVVDDFASILKQGMLDRSLPLWRFRESNLGPNTTLYRQEREMPGPSSQGLPCITVLKPSTLTFRLALRVTLSSARLCRRLVWIDHLTFHGSHLTTTPRVAPHNNPTGRTSHQPQGSHLTKIPRVAPHDNLRGRASHQPQGRTSQQSQGSHLTSTPGVAPHNNPTGSRLTSIQGVAPHNNPRGRASHEPQGSHLTTIPGVANTSCLWSSRPGRPQRLGIVLS